MWQIAEVVNMALDDFFPTASLGDVQIIAEPGRFYVASAYTLATLIHSKRNTMYYINDGVYGSFNCVLFDHAVVKPVPLVVSHLLYTARTGNYNSSMSKCSFLVLINYWLKKKISMIFPQGVSVLILFTSVVALVLSTELV